MDPIKQRVLELIASDRIRRRKHFDEQAGARGVILEEVLQALVSGALLRGEADDDPRYGERFRFHGRDRSGRTLDVIVSIDEDRSLLWLHTVFPTGRRGARK
jgi:hypothetical protein